MLPATQIGTPGGVPMPLEWLLRGSSWSGGDALTRTPPPDPVRQRRDRRKLRIASFIALTGSAGIWGPAATNSSHAGGLGDQPAWRHPGPRRSRSSSMMPAAPSTMSCSTASDVVASDDADIIMGTHISAVRVALSARSSAGRIPYIYTPVYEGGERTPGVMAIGETPRAQTAAGDPVAGRRQEGRAMVPDRQRLRLAVALPSRSQEATSRMPAGASSARNSFRLGEHDHDAPICAHSRC